MNPNQQRSRWGVALLSMGMGIAFVVGGGWMLAPYFVCPEVEAARFNAAEHNRRYIQLNATESFDVGFQVEYRASEPGSENDPANRVARFVAVPVGSRVLIVRLPMEYQGRSYRGIVKELTPDIEMGLVRDSANSTFRDLQRRMETFRQEMEAAHNSGFAPGRTIGSATENFRRTPSLKDLALPVYLDAKEDERWAACLVIVVGLTAVGGGLAIILRPNAPPAHEIEAITGALELDHPRANLASGQGTTAKEAVDFAPATDATAKRTLTVCCPQGHTFEVDLMYRGTTRKCPACGQKVSIPAE